MKVLSFLLSFLLFGNIASAGVNWQRGDYFNNVGGLNDTFSPIDIEANEAADLQNVVLTNGGAIQTREGFDNLNTTVLTGVVTGLKYFKPTSGNQYLVGITDADTFVKMDYAVGGAPDGTFDDITGGASIAVTTSDLADFATGQDTLVIEDGIGTTAPFKWTGSGNVALLSGSPPNASMVAFHKRQLFLAGNSTNPSILYFSDVGNIETWSGSNLSGNVAVETNDGSVIRAIHPGPDSLYIWKDHSIWRLSGDDKDNYHLQRMVDGIGTLSQHSVVLIGSDFIFQDANGDIYIYDGGFKVRLLSSKIETSIDALNFSRWNKTLAIEFDKDYYAAFSTSASSTHNRILVFNTLHLAWTKFVGMNVNAWTVGDDGTGKNILYFADYSGWVHKYPTGTNDNGTAISAYYLTKQFRLPELNIFKVVRKIFSYFDEESSTNVDVELRTDFQTAGQIQTVNLLGSSARYGTAIYGTATYGGGTIITGEQEWDKQGKFFQLRFANDDLDQSFTLRGFQILAESEDRI